MNLIEKIKLGLALQRAQKEIKMKGIKSFLKSKTLHGILTAAIPLISELTGIASDQLGGMLGNTIQAIGLLWATYGRFVAKDRIGFAITEGMEQ